MIFHATFEDVLRKVNKIIDVDADLKTPRRIDLLGLTKIKTKNIWITEISAASKLISNKSNM